LNGMRNGKWGRTRNGEGRRREDEKNESERPAWMKKINRSTSLVYALPIADQLSISICMLVLKGMGIEMDRERDRERECI
jgi:hypothetical protein